MKDMKNKHEIYFDEYSNESTQMPMSEQIIVFSSLIFILIVMLLCVFYCAGLLFTFIQSFF